MFETLFRSLTGTPLPSTSEALRADPLWRAWFAVQATFWLAVVVFAIATAFDSVGKPNLGLDLMHNATTSPFSRGEVPPLSQVVALNGEPVASADALIARVNALPVGSPLRYRFLGHGPEVTLHSGVTAGLEPSFWSAWGPGVAHLLVGAVVLWLAPLHPAARAHWFFCQALGFALLGNYINDQNYTLAHFWYPAVALVVAATAHLGLELPVRITGRWRTAVLGLGWGITAILLLVYVWASSEPLHWAVMHHLHMAAPSAALVLLLLHCAWASVSRRYSERDRSRARVVVCGVAIAFMLPIAAYFLATLGSPHLPWLSHSALFASFAAFALFPVSIGYAVIRHQLFDIAFIIRRATLYVGVTAGLGALYALSVALVHALTGAPARAGVPEAAAAIATALAFHPLYRAVRRGVDRAFLGERADALETIEAFSRRLPAEAAAVANELVELLMRALRPTGLRLRFEALHLEAGAVPEQGELVVPLMARGLIRGELVLGPLVSGMPYSRADRALVSVLARQVAAALDNARLFEAQVALAADEAIARRMAEERRALLQQVVHDVRSDLFNIQLIAHRLAGLPETTGAASGIARSLGRIDALLGEKTLWLQQGRPEAASTDLGGALDNASGAIAPLLETRAQRLVIDGPVPDVELPVTAVEVHQVLMNLLGNAHKFSPAGAVIRLEARLSANGLVIAVEDEGPGLPPALLAAPTCGHRADPTVPGSGLGLGNARRLLEQAGGCLRWRNLERGCRFEACWPAPARAPRPAGRA